MDRADIPSDLKTTDPTLEFFDMRDISPPLVLRTRRQGDRIRPFGLGGTKKLKDLFIDLKIPWELKSTYALLTDREGLLWVAGLKRSDRARITEETREVLSAKWRPD
jgi:tRNA(Ile)-lysidine synthase